MKKFLNIEKANTDSLIKITNVKVTSVVMLFFCALLIINTLEAYSIINIPFEWLSYIGFIAVIIFLSADRNLYYVPGSKVLIFLFLWAVIINSVNIFFTDYFALMPTLSTTSYPLFICLRFIRLLSFIAAIYSIYWLLMKENKYFIIKWTVIIGTLASIIAIYYYFVWVYGLPAPIPNRLSTAGNIPIEIGMYTYAFHRAVGTFREPNQLAAWLVVPFFLSFIYCKKKLNIYAIIIGVTILLTGSLTGIIGGIIGFVAAIIITNIFKPNNLKIFIQAIVLILIAVTIFNILAVSYTAEKVNIFKVVRNRMTPIFKGGMIQSNRGYVYKYISNISFVSVLFGSGLGNANILLSQYLNGNLMASFINLYFNFLCSTGIFGVILLSIFLLSPVMKVMLSKKNRQNSQIIFINSAYISHLVMHTVYSEEFTIMFALIYALMIYEIRKHKNSS